jgi:hypothetical protein
MIPDIGTHNFTNGESVSCSVTSSPVNNGTTQYVCTGWSGSGSVPAFSQCATWARYALWMKTNNGMYFSFGAKFYGAIYSGDQLSFIGNPEFFGECRSSALTFGGETNAVIFTRDSNWVCLRRP